MKIQGNTILVAGAAGGIGRGVAELLQRLGNEVIVFGAGARAEAGLRVVDLDLACPWSVAAFSERVAAACPELNMLVDVAIAFPLSHLPGLQALLDDDVSHRQREAHRLGLQQLTGALLPHFRKRVHSSVMKVSVGPVLARGRARPSALSAWTGGEAGLHASALSVNKRWAGACIEVMDVARPSRAERMNPEAGYRSEAMSRPEFISSLAHLLAESVHEAATLARLRAVWPPVVHKSRDDDRMLLAG